eukprot:gnl/TRDRNA2_/TRDRNA2_197398_c0_seq1.p1 gnl/TRDRNA2_/TRDRNA2_197398_c0~~gnl/TRDRNA2_/TRDRNA2_197398_c0_seq1.p1  ORF type:complete len:186 (+),score=35.61 gnl/TRDRNA2_/TRDRNA2_197398_c0_seq1:84-560(+)
MPDAATISVFGHGLSELFLAFRMSVINVQNMAQARAAAKAGKDAKEAAVSFLQTPFYKNWSRAQLNNTEFAPMLALLCFMLKYKVDRENRKLTISEKVACFGSVIFSYMFCYAVATQGIVDPAKARPGQGGMSPLRPIGAMGRYVSMALLLYHIVAKN